MGGLPAPCVVTPPAPLAAAPPSSAAPPPYSGLHTTHKLYIHSLRGRRIDRAADEGRGYTYTISGRGAYGNSSTADSSQRPTGSQAKGWNASWPQDTPHSGTHGAPSPNTHSLFDSLPLLSHRVLTLVGVGGDDHKLLPTGNSPRHTPPDAVHNRPEAPHMPRYRRVLHVRLVDRPACTRAQQLHINTARTLACGCATDGSRHFAGRGTHISNTSLSSWLGHTETVATS